MESRLPGANSGIPHQQESTGNEPPAQQQQQRQLSLLLQTAERDTLSVCEETQSRRTSSLSSSVHDQIRETQDVLYSPRSFTPPEGSSSGSVKYTRTGRVSKAAKGQRIHACHIDSCEKVFSRAEHLRRHQLSHQHGSFVCDVAGCTRTFAREDLLVRHRARHAEGEEDPGRKSSGGSQGSGADSGGLKTLSALSQVMISGANTAMPQPLSAGSGGNAQRSDQSGSIPPKRRPIPPNELAMPLLAMEVYGPFAGIEYNPWSNPTPLELELPAYDFDSSPDEIFGELPYFQDQSMEPIDLPSAAMLARDHPLCLSRSSTSDSSSSLSMNSQWQPLPPPVYEIPFNPEDRSCAALTFSPPTAIADLKIDTTEPDIGLLDLLPSEEDLELENRYVDAHFAWIHDLLPVLHKPSFLSSSREESPLLRTAVLALGACALGRSGDATRAHGLHEKCSKMLERRTIGKIHTICISDMQAIVLVEMYSIFISRNSPSFKVSKKFEDVYQILSKDPECLTTASPHDTEKPHRKTIERHCKQRLILACYLISQQHALLFGTSSSLTLPRIRPEDLPFPTPQTQWDSPLPISHPSPKFENLAEALTSASKLTAPARDHHDAFRSLLLISAATSSDLKMSQKEVKGVLRAIEPSPRIHLAFHTGMLCRLTPVKDLLAVVSGEKSSEDTAAQARVREWATDQTDDDGGEMCIKTTALSHAIPILEIHRKEARTGLLWQEWSVFLAGLVIWGVWANIQSDQKESEVEESSDLEMDIDAIITRAGDTFAYIGGREARSVLLWIQRDFESLRSGNGLVCRALHLLGEMVESGLEEMWR